VPFPYPEYRIFVGTRHCRLLICSDTAVGHGSAVSLPGRISVGKRHCRLLICSHTAVGHGSAVSLPGRIFVGTRHCRLLICSNRRVCRHQQSLKNIDDLTATHLLSRIIVNKHNIYCVAIFCQNGITKRISNLLRLKHL